MSAEKYPELSAELSALREKGRYRSLLRVSSPQGPVLSVEGRRVLNFSSNNYLGLANHPAVVLAMAETAARYGAGSGASRLICGHMDVHAELEDAVARFKGTESALTFSAGYLANLGIVQTLGGPGATVFTDALNHASIIDGCRMSRSRVEVFRHRDVGQLEDRLRASKSRRKIVVTDGVFSMDGDLAPLPELVEVKERHGALLVVDDAHATGALPPRGAGTASYFGIAPGAIDVHMGTFSKALGTYGAYIGASRTVIDYFVNRCRPFIYNTGLPPAVAGATIAARKILREDPSLHAALGENRAAFRRAMEGHGRTAASETAIVPIVVGGDRETMEVSRELFEAGVYIHGIRPPTVPEGTGRLRLTLMAPHTPEMIEAAAALIHGALAKRGL